MRTRRTRAEQVEGNRALLLAAARDAFVELGYHGASVDVVAERAGFSKGAVYSQFGGKDELFLAVLEERIRERADENRRAIAAAQRGEELSALLTLARWNILENRAWMLTLLEFRLHAARDPELNQRYAELHSRTLSGLTAAFGRIAKDAGVDLPVGPEEVSRFVMALDSGYTLELQTSPEAPVETALLAVTRLLGIPINTSQIFGSDQ